MSRVTFSALAAALLCCGASHAQTYVTFFVTDQPGTFVESMNAEGVITGYAGTWGSAVGFVRKINGEILTFSVPGADETIPRSINSRGEIAGTASGSFGFRGFIRSPDGEISVFDAPGGSYHDTRALSINQNGVITGMAYGKGFIRQPNGSFEVFAVGGYTVPESINNAGAVTGFTFGVGHFGFVRSAQGQITTFYWPGSFADTAYYAINASGVITGGFHSCPVGGMECGFVRAQDGTLSLIELSGMAFVHPRSINPRGEIAGCASATPYPDDYRGFVLEPDGSYSLFDVPGASGTCPTAINAGGIIAGYASIGGMQTGFVRIPHP